MTPVGYSVLIPETSATAARVMRPEYVSKPFPPPCQGGENNCQESSLIILGVILLIIGFVAQVAVIWTIGIIVVVAGAVLALLGGTGHAVRGRRHYF